MSSLPNSTPSQKSRAAKLAALPPKQRRAAIAKLSEADAAALLYEWRFWARPSQIAPDGDWLYWLLLAGRGFGKTRSAVEWTNERVLAGAKHLILAGPTAGDVRDIMVDGESGLLAKSPPWNMPVYEASKARLTWPGGAVALLLSADKPDRFRGKQSDTVWAEELASWRYPEAWDQIQLGCRLGAGYGVTPKFIVSTTPRPTPIIKALVADERSVLSTGSTYENKANLAPTFIRTIIGKYEGTRLGRQELHAEILADAPGAMWNRDQIDSLRVSIVPELKAIAVAVDPSVSTNAKSNETGIIVVGVGIDGHGYVLEDLSGVYTPETWGAIVVEAYIQWKANYVVAEVNQGGDLVVANIATAARNRAQRVIVPVRTVHASRGKAIRAEPVAALGSQGRIHHVGSLAVLEDQLCTWEPSLPGSPDRLDAYVWGFTDLMVDRDAGGATVLPRAFGTKLQSGSVSTSGKFQW